MSSSYRKTNDVALQIEFKYTKQRLKYLTQNIQLLNLKLACRFLPDYPTRHYVELKKKLKDMLFYIFIKENKSKVQNYVYKPLTL